MKQYEIRYLDAKGYEHVEHFENMDEVRAFYKDDFPDTFTTVFFKSLKSGRIVE